MQLRQVLSTHTVRGGHIIHIAGHDDHREIGSQRKEHHIDGIANGIQPEALVVADTGQKLSNYGTGNKTDATAILAPIRNSIRPITTPLKRTLPAFGTLARISI